VLCLTYPFIVAIDWYQQNEMFRSLMQGFGISVLIVFGCTCFSMAFDEWREAELRRSSKPTVDCGDEPH